MLSLEYIQILAFTVTFMAGLLGLFLVLFKPIYLGLSLNAISINILKYAELIDETAFTTSDILLEPSGIAKYGKRGEILISNSHSVIKNTEYATIMLFKFDRDISLKYFGRPSFIFLQNIYSGFRLLVTDRVHIVTNVYTTIYVKEVK